ncbi:DNA polymerase III subunit beta family protein [Nonomuraea sp. NPDC003754]
MTTSTCPAIVTLTGTALRQYLGAVLPHASTDDTLPILTAVTFEVADGALYALATDRYTMGIVRQPLDTDQPHPTSALSVIISAAALQATARQVKARARVTLTVTEQAVTIEQAGAFTLACRLPALEMSPLLSNWRTWFADQVRNKPDRAVHTDRGTALAPAYLARFRPATRDHLPLQFRPAGRAVVVTCGEHFLGLISPRRPTEQETAQPDPLDSWLPANEVADAKAA